MRIDRQTIMAVYISCTILFGAVLAANGFRNLDQIFLCPLDNSYSVLGKHSVFKDYLGSNRVYTFLPYWNLDGRDINLENVTDLSYFGLSINEQGRVITNDGGYIKWRGSKVLPKAFSDLKRLGGSPSVTLICQDDAAIDAVLDCESCWNDLAEDVKQELNWAGIKDVNVDFEYMGYTTQERAEKFTRLVGFLNGYLDAEFGDSFVVVSTYADSADRSEKAEVRLTNPQELGKVADGLFIMAYDFHRPTSNYAGPVSPLDGSYTTSRLNLTTAIDSYLEVVPASKLILGLPFYGYDWVVEDLSPMSARIEGNDLIGYSKVKTYAEVTDFLIRKNIKPQFHDISKSFYFNYVDLETGSNRQVWYDNAESLGYKVSLASRNNLLGVGVWALGYEGGYADLWKVFKLRT